MKEKKSSRQQRFRIDDTHTKHDPDVPRISLYIHPSEWEDLRAKTGKLAANLAREAFGEIEDFRFDRPVSAVKMNLLLDVYAKYLGEDVVGPRRPKCLTEDTIRRLWKTKRFHGKPLSLATYLGCSHRVIVKLLDLYKDFPQPYEIHHWSSNDF